MKDEAQKLNLNKNECKTRDKTRQKKKKIEFFALNQNTLIIKQSKKMKITATVKMNDLAYFLRFSSNALLFFFFYYKTQQQAIHFVQMLALHSYEARKKLFFLL